eukprot:1153098-Pelagomonas_calceolata.AAC.8
MPRSCWKEQMEECFTVYMFRFVLPLQVSGSSVERALWATNLSNDVHVVQVWDIRTSVPLATLDGHKDKALCVGWAGGDTLLSGGADCKMLSYSMNNQQLRS